MFVRTDVTFSNHFRNLSIFPTHHYPLHVKRLRYITLVEVGYYSCIGSENRYENFSQMRNSIDNGESDVFCFGVFVDAGKRGRPSFVVKVG